MNDKRIKINTAPVASLHAKPGERIIEFSSPGGGGLISFRLVSDPAGVVIEALTIDIYRTDPSVIIRS